MIDEKQLQEWAGWASRFLAMDDDDHVLDGWEEWFEKAEGIHVHKEYHLATVAIPALIAEVRRLRNVESCLENISTILTNYRIGNISVDVCIRAIEGQHMKALQNA